MPGMCLTSFDTVLKPLNFFPFLFLSFLRMSVERKGTFARILAGRRGCVGGTFSAGIRLLSPTSHKHLLEFRDTTAC